jgi:hypothetical protein
MSQGSEKAVGGEFLIKVGNFEEQGDAGKCFNQQEPEEPQGKFTGPD